MCGPSEHAQPPYFYLLQVSVRGKSAALKGRMIKRGTASHEMQSCMLPRELIWEGVAPPQEIV